MKNYLFLISSLLLITYASPTQGSSCPAVDGEFAVHIPHESDCTKYYKCNHGARVLQECSPDLHFNAILEVCDWPQVAGCEPGTGTTTQSTGDCNDEDPTTPCPGETTPDPGNWVGECPEEDGEFATHLPHKDDCTKFYICNHGTPLLQECPPTLHFNPIAEVCDWPETAGCEPGTGTTTQSTGDCNGDESTTTCPDGSTATTDADDENWVGECPEENGEDLVLLPHGSDCTKFYKCDWGQPILQECPSGLHFNPREQVCDWPENAGCEGEGEDESEEETSTDSTEGNTTPDIGSSTGTSAPPPEIGNGECPAENGDYAVLLPHESDCTKFYKCDWGQPILQECPSGLHFNPREQVCDWPENAGCEGEGEDESEEETSTDSTEGNTTPDIGSSTGTSAPPPEIGNGECPAENGDYAVLLPHESDCTKFYKCDWGQPILQECPSGLHFNPREQVCDWPENAGCEGEGEDESEEETSTDSTEGNTTPDIGSSTGTSVPPPEIGNGECPAENGDYAVLLPHESDCTKFYKCDWGQPILQECPSGLHFNPREQVCDWPENAGCEGEGEDESEEETSTDSTEGNTTPDIGSSAGTSAPPPETGNGECPAENGDYAVHLPHESDCTKFYKCDWGQPILQECPSGLHFNPREQVCDWPENAGCEGGGEDESEEETSTDSTEGNTTPDIGSSTGTSAPPPEIGNGECPAENGDYAVLLPHKSDCTKFYKCDWGQPILQECPSGLHFNPREQVCDWPENAGCEGEGEDESEEETSTDSTEGNTTPDIGSSAGTSAPPPETGNGECPAENGDYAVHLPHESDCTKFYKCDWGQPILQECPSGLHFNPREQVCDWPENAGCEGEGEDESEEETNTDSTEGNTTPDIGSSAGTSAPPPETGNGECPAENGDYAVHLPHESDCAKFYKCDWGQPILQECPSGLHFNPREQVCDWPENAGCEGEGEDESEEETSTDSTEGNTTPDIGSSTGTSAPPPETGNGECPAENGDYAVHLPHESDCTKFYKCDWGQPILQECPSGLHFNPREQVCDWPENAGCEGEGEDESEEETSTDSTEGNTTPDIGSSTGTSAPPPETGNGECPAENGDYPVHLPHESDCTKFYKCDWGQPILQECPSGLHFNPREQVCDWPENAGCEGEGEDESEEETSTDSTEGNTTPDIGSSTGTSAPPPETGNGECPAENGDYPVHLPHESDCTKFYKCDWGQPILQECPSGLHFNPREQVCDWPENAGCEGEGEDESEEETSTDSTEGNTTPDIGSSTGTSAPPPETGNGECPAENGDYPVHLPHESDCTKFYKCDWGQPILQECPSGLHFNPREQVCDWPENAGCEGDSEEETGTDSTEDNTTPDIGSSTGTSAPPPGTGNGECPTENGDYAVHLPHENDCTKFYICDWGQAILQECPNGLHFNPREELCDWPENAGCEDDSEEEISTEDNTTPDIGSSSGTSAPPPGTGNGECPAENGDYAVYLPHENDCTKFYICDWGQPILQECPNGLHFNPREQLCDWPENAGCEDDSEEEISTEDNTTPDIGSSTGTSAPPPETGNGECPAENGEYTVHLPHESDCTKFYKCDWGKPVLQECADGLHFNPREQVCDWPENAGCEDGDAASPENGGGCVGEGCDEDATNEIGRGLCDTLGCPVLNGRQVYFLPYPNDCTRFCKCDWGAPYEFNCPGGLHFNPQLDVCDYPDNAGCSV